MTKYFEFFNPVKIIYGKNSLESLSYEIERKRIQNPLILFDKSKTQGGIIDNLSQYVKCHTYIDVNKCDINTVKEIKERFFQNKNDCIIALGDKRVVDTSKLAKSMIGCNRWDLKGFWGYENLEIRSLPPLIVLPSEIWSNEALKEVTIKENNSFKTIVSPLILPDAILINENMFMDRDANQIAQKGLFALTCAIESASCLQKTVISEIYSYSAIKIISENLIEAVENPFNKEKLIPIGLAALMAQISFNNSMGGLAYSIGLSAEETTKISSEEIAYLIMPYVMEFNLKKLKNKYSNMLLYLGGEKLYAGVKKEKRGRMSVELFRQFMERLHKAAKLRLSLNKTTFSQKDILPVAERVMSRHNTLFNPVAVSQDNVIEILKRAF